MYDVYPAIFDEQDGRYLVRIPDVPGCVTGGTSLSEAFCMARDALAGCLCAYEDQRMELPAKKRIADLKAAYPDALIAMVDVDTIEYRKRTESKFVRRTVSLPQWLDTLAAIADVSLSQTLQEALLQKLT